jgi:chromosomal replication initiation ATPase DnaA
MNTTVPITYSPINRPTTLFCDRTHPPLRFRDVNTCERVAREVADAFGVSVPELRGKARPYHLSYPRQITQFLLAEMGEPAVYIGSYFGCDRTCVLHNKGAVEERMSVDAKFSARVEQLRKRLEVQP